MLLKVIFVLCDVEVVMYGIVCVLGVVYMVFVLNVCGVECVLLCGVDEVNFVMLMSESYNCVNLWMMCEQLFV